MKLSAGDGDPLTTLWDGQMCHTKGEMHFSLMSLIVPMYSRSMLCRYPKHSVYVVFIISSVCYVAMLCLLHTLLFLMRSSISHASPFLIRPVSWSTHKHPYHHLYIYRISSFWMLMKNQWADIQSYQHSVPVKSWCFFNPKFHREIDPMISRREVL